MSYEISEARYLLGCAACFMPVLIVVVVGMLASGFAIIFQPRARFRAWWYQRSVAAARKRDHVDLMAWVIR